MIVLLIAVAIFMTFRRQPKPGEHAKHRHGLPSVAIFSLLISTYDGFFGPGTGTFLITAFVAFMGLPLARASADAKVVNFASNLASVILFASRGVVLWEIALPMAAANITGGYLGARLAMAKGARFVRAFFLVVVSGFVVRLGGGLLGWW